jgi:hypothetical protein
MPPKKPFISKISAEEFESELKLERQSMPDEEKKNLSVNRKGIKMPSSMCRRLSEYRLGKNHTQETKDKIASKATGREPTDKQLESLRAKNLSDAIKQQNTDRWFANPNNMS